jgi:hypothetical protein
MKLTDKILRMKQDMSDFDKEVLTKLREIHETISFVDDTNLYDGHIVSIDAAGDTISLDIIYEPLCYDGFDNEHVCVPLCYFDMTKEELIKEKQREEEALREKNIVKMYNKKLSDLKQMREQIEQMNDQMNVLKAEIVAVQEEAEELKRLSEKE